MKCGGCVAVARRWKCEDLPVSALTLVFFTLVRFEQLQPDASAGDEGIPIDLLLVILSYLCYLSVYGAGRLVYCYKC